MRLYLKEHPQVCAEIEKLIRVEMLEKKAPVPAAMVEEDNFETVDD